MDAAAFARCLARIRRRVRRLDAPVMRLTVLRGRDPFRIAVGTILSARTRDDTLAPVLEALFHEVRSPADLRTMSAARLRRLIRPTGFYRTKARALRAFAAALLERHGGRVPDTLPELLALRGVGPKVAAIILVDAFGQDAVSVDTHVHRICNRLGLVRTRTPAETHAALTRRLPRRLWRHVNLNLVALGQTTCQPRRPACPRCPVDALCEKVGVRPATDRGGAAYAGRVPSASRSSAMRAANDGRAWTPAT
jgi:endonuclease-3